MSTEIIICTIKLIWIFFGENAAEIIAVCALAFTIWQAIVSRKHNQLSVVPDLQFELTISKTEPQVSIHLTNHGLGPAKIKKYSLFIDKKEINISDGVAAFNSIHKKINLGIEMGGDSLGEGYLIASGVQKRLFDFITVKGIDSKLNHLEIEDKFDRLQIIVEYESLYGLKLKKKFHVS